MLQRREFLQTGLAATGLGAAATLLTPVGSLLADASPVPPAKDQPDVLRVAFLTDTHLPFGKPEIAERVAAAITAIQERESPPDLFLFGGDNVMNVDGGTPSRESVFGQFDLWSSQVQERLQVPSLSVIGNHDIWWKAPASDVDRPEKTLAIERFGMTGRYYSRQVGAWRFILLDCFQSSGCELDELQWEWLAQELSTAQSPVCVVTHAPILSVTHFYEPSTQLEGGGYKVPASWAVNGGVRFRELFRKHPHVRLALSGHMHTIDRVDVDQTSYVCGGAVSGAWWGGDYLGFQNAWTEFLLSPDGTWSRQVHLI